LRQKQGNYNASADNNAGAHAIPALPVKPIGLLNREKYVNVSVVYVPITCFPAGEVVYNVIRIFYTQANDSYQYVRCLIQGVISFRQPTQPPGYSWLINNRK
jgi:hypothetical protein